MKLQSRLAAPLPAPLRIDGGGEVSPESLESWIAAASPLLSGQRPLALISGNSAEVLAAEMAATRAGRPLLVLPCFFADDALRHALDEVAPEWILCDDAALAARLGAGQASSCLGRLGIHPSGRLARTPPPRRCARITYTSGSTGRPKGLCLSWTMLERSLASLQEAIGARSGEVFLSFMPYSILLETLAGLYLPLICGGRSVILPGIRRPLAEAEAVLAAIERHQVAVTVMMPQLLRDLCLLMRRQGLAAPPCLRFIGVGGARVGRDLIEEAHRLGLPVREGYGLTEAASVVCLNTAAAMRPGSVGRPLPHCRLHLAADGEILVDGDFDSCFLDGSAPFLDAEGRLATGDLGEIDAEGYLHVVGRKKNLFISSLGRNLSPEWLEEELLREAGLRRAFVFGEGRPAPLALIETELAPDELEALRLRVNGRLGAHARLAELKPVGPEWFLQPGLLTPNGRFQRPACEAAAARLFATSPEEIPR
ncbi:MAG: hypothetical protein RL095_1941 [Verrucomicrobiota bacterium]|jgi:long-subunit acyl-CoA synthetase (AMP-forming)